MDSCSYNFGWYKNPRKLKSANIYPYVFEEKSRKFGDAKIFHFAVNTAIIIEFVDPGPESATRIGQ